MCKVGTIGLLILGYLVAFYLIGKDFTKPRHLGNFPVTAEKIAKDLEGRSVVLPFGQMWPFDASQGITVTVMGKKQVDDFVVVAIEVQAVANVPPSKEEKSQPAKIALGGAMKLTYEIFGKDWYLVAAEGLTLRARSVNAQ